MTQLDSYLNGQWVRGNEPTVPLRDASTGETVATVSAAGLDLRAALEHARRDGGPQLRAMTFHERAGLLRSLVQYLAQFKEEFYTLSACTGATRTDSWIDIDGGLGTVSVYASKGVKELPNARVLSDGALERLSKGGSFVGQHIYVPREGVAIHINAFNFPVWGMLEKLAPTLLAGVPMIVKPATTTAYLTERVAHRIVESGLLPAGAFQLICGGVGNLLDELACSDTVSFTGSAETALQLRSRPLVLRRGVRFIAETDSLNASILGPDVASGSPEFGLFVREVTREMTVKAGQKCTAIRRVLVPQALAGALAEALSAELAKVVVGDPRRDGVTMGPLSSVSQRAEVLARVAELREEAEVVTGESASAQLIGDGEHGGFVAPVLLRARDPRSAHRIHTVEAFGPVATLIAYDGLSQAIEFVRRGEGSLVASIVTADRAVSSTLLTGIAPYHGRVLILDQASSKESTGHGIALAQLVHGGPGRAGGSEELGGIRGVTHYMQRTAVQGDPALLTALGLVPAASGPSV